MAKKSILDFFQSESMRPSLSTDQERVEVQKALEQPAAKRGKYSSWTAKDRAEIGKFAHVHGNKATKSHFLSRYPELTRQTIDNFKRYYEKEKQKNQDKEIVTIKLKPRGRPTLLPTDIMDKTIQTVKCLRLKGAPVSSSVICAIARGMIMANDRSLLVENGGSVRLNKDWARQVLYRMESKGEKMVRRMGTTSKIPVAPAFLNETKLDYQRRYKSLQQWHDIPKDLIINFDQTPLPYICAAKHTLEQKGAKSVPLVGKGKSKQITGTFAISQMGDFLPIQLIYEGKTKRCLPPIDFPNGFNVTYTENHWSNEEKSIEFIETIILPFLKSSKKKLGLPSDQKSMLIFDVFRGQTTKKVSDLIEENDCVILHVPNNMTNYFQMLDLNLNGHAKEFLKTKFEEWYAEQVKKQLDQGKSIYDVEVSMKLSDMKPKHAQWLIGLYDHLRNSREMILKSWEMAGLEEAFESELPPEDPFADLE